MLALALRRLEREGTLSLRVEVPAEDPRWEGSRLHFQRALAVELEARSGAEGEVLVCGTLTGVLRDECRRCLDPLEVRVEEEVAFLFAPPDRTDLLEDPEVREIPADAVELDLFQAIREELMLRVSPYPLCRAECRGLCPRCGVNLNRERCECTLHEPDPRWDALRALKNE